MHSCATPSTRVSPSASGASCTRRAGDAIARTVGDHVETEAELLSMHSYHAQRYADAWRYARIAGTRAKSKYANTEAAELLERALAGGAPRRRGAPRPMSPRCGRRSVTCANGPASSTTPSRHTAARRLQAGDPPREAVAAREGSRDRRADGSLPTRRSRPCGAACGSSSATGREAGAAPGRS